MASWRSVALKKKAEQEALIPKEWRLDPIPSSNDVSSIPETCGLLDANELEFTNSDIAVLLDKLAQGHWSSVSVTKAFSKRAIIAHQLTNCLTEIFIERALGRAAELDEYLKSTGNVRGPLHGLPVSLKDQINVEGLESCMGYISWIGQFAERNAVVADILEEAGAILFVKTNIPQTLMWPETFNHVFGRTSNPYNRSLTCGGSSGGEGTLVAMRGSPLGVGSDIGGSVRIPAAFCGTYGLRPSYGRAASTPSKVKIQYHPLAVRKRWSEDEYRLADHGEGKQLCFAILWDDGIITPHPPITRGLRMAKEALLRAASSFQVIDWKAHKHSEMYSTLSEIWASGAEEDYGTVAAPTGEPVIASMSLENQIALEGGFDHNSIPRSAYQLWQLHRKKRDLREEHLQVWEDTVKITGTGRPVDAIISPVAPYAAVGHGNNKSANYTAVWNLLDYTALVIPVAQVDSKLDSVNLPQLFHSHIDRRVSELLNAGNQHLVDNPEDFENAPISLQVIGRTLEEEAVIGMGEILDTALKVIKVETK
ncbi:hypothetical protein D9757_004595 [Collybiopsis confluens]|uniref:amidase n=1 Tax=Collybiopsis confluens TaxID=2823264 RepID=A0A8H5HS77_9AGAR|nr:hypothetical protein D9757_004595 [Collybiopsis confluens]